METKRIWMSATDLSCGDKGGEVWNHHGCLQHRGARAAAAAAVAAGLQRIQGMKVSHSCR